MDFIVSGLFHVGRRHSIPRRERRKQKAADLHQAGGWRFQMEIFSLPASAGHIGGSFSTSMAPWHLHSQVAVSFPDSS
jgi:hypothetical protein